MKNQKKSGFHNSQFKVLEKNLKRAQTIACLELGERLNPSHTFLSAKWQVQTVGTFVQFLGLLLVASLQW